VDGDKDATQINRTIEKHICFYKGNTHLNSLADWHGIEIKNVVVIVTTTRIERVHLRNAMLRAVSHLTVLFDVKPRNLPKIYPYPEAKDIDVPTLTKTMMRCAHVIDKR